MTSKVAIVTGAGSGVGRVDAASVAALFEQTKAHYGSFDLIFNNAGMNNPATPLEDVALEDWKRFIDVNLTCLFLCSQHAFRLVKTQSPIGGGVFAVGFGVLTLIIRATNLSVFGKLAAMGMRQATRSILSSIPLRRFSLARRSLRQERWARPL